MILSVEAGAEALLEFLTISGHQKPQWESNILEKTANDRMVVQYSFYDRESQWERKPFLTLIGKFYADETGEQTYRIMRVLMTTLSQTGTTPLLAIPQPLFYDPVRRFLAQERAEGVPYRELLSRSDYRKNFRLAGKALAMLHAQRVPAGETKWIRDHLTELIHPHPMRLAEQIPWYRPLVERLIETMGEREKEWKKEIDVSPLHRDFHLRQLFYGQDQVWVIDWDLFAKGDPALDVGNFVVYLKTHLTQRCLPSIDAFLEGYFSDRPSSILERVPLYEALTYLRLACKRFRLKGDYWREKVNEMLLRSEKCLMGKSACGTWDSQ